MTKAVFQIGMLAACVATVFFALDRTDIFEILGKSFIVFAAVVSGGIVVLMIISTFVAKKQDEERAAALAEAESAQARGVPEPVK
jgi:hypothetical protein